LRAFSCAVADCSHKNYNSNSSENDTILMPTQNLAKLLFGKYRRRILAVLLLRPENSFYVRELARLAEVPPGSLHRELRQLAESGLLLRREVGNQVRYQANRDCPVFEELAGFFRKTAGLADILREALGTLAPDIQLAFVFGSIARGKERPTSDVDVFVIGGRSFTDVVMAFAGSHARLGREVNPVVMHRAEFLQKFQQGDRFIGRILNEPKIFLIGSKDDLEKLIEDRAAQGEPA
jgi:predicted nucleotidyltransferase/DNA-binding HxlR family transcriptional regulator